MAGKEGECSAEQSEFHLTSSQDDKEEEKEEEPTFIEQPPDRLNCLICHCVMKEPHIAICCSRKMCRDCIQRVHLSGQPCPNCREPNFSIFLEKQLNSEILDLKVRCTHYRNGCEWVGELRDLKKHTNPVNGSCGFIKVKCPFGCPVAYLRKDTINHESVCTNLPPEKQIRRTMRITDQFKEELQATSSQFQELYKSESTRVKELTTQLEGLKESHKKEQQEMKNQFEAEKKQLLEESKQQIALLTESLKADFTQEMRMKNEEHQQKMMQLQQKEFEKKEKERSEAVNKQLAESKERKEQIEKQHQKQLIDIKDKMSIEFKQLLEESKQQIALLTKSLRAEFTQELKIKNEEHRQQMMQLQKEFEKKEKERSEAVNKQLTELKEKEKQMEIQHQKQLIDIKDKLSTELKQLYQDEHKQRMEESKEESKNIHLKLKQHYDEEYQQQLKEAKAALELEKRKQLEEVRIMLAAEKEKLITKYEEECKKATTVTQTNLFTENILTLPSHNAQHNQAIHTHNPIPEQVPDEGGSNEAAATGSDSAGDGRTFTGLSKDVLLLMPKVREDCSKNMEFFPEEGKVIILASSEEEQEQCITQFCNMYQEIIKNRQLKSGSLEIPPSFQIENIFDLLEEFDGKYNLCHFSCDKKARVVKIISMSSRQFDQAKKLITDRLAGEKWEEKTGKKKEEKEGGGKPGKGAMGFKISTKPGSSEVLSINKGRKLTVKRSNIVEEDVDVIVNAANSRLDHGAGVAGALNKASRGELQRASDTYVRNYGQIPVGGAAVTSAGGKLKCKRVIHAVGPMASSQMNDLACSQLIYQAITNSLIEAEKMRAASISFPPLSTGIYAVNKSLAADDIFQAILKYHYTNNSILKDIRIIILDEDTYSVFAQHLLAIKFNPPIHTETSFKSPGADTHGNNVSQSNSSSSHGSHTPGPAAWSENSLATGGKSKTWSGPTGSGATGTGKTAWTGQVAAGYSTESGAAGTKSNAWSTGYGASGTGKTAWTGQVAAGFSTESGATGTKSNAWSTGTDLQHSQVVIDLTTKGVMRQEETFSTPPPSSPPSLPPPHPFTPPANNKIAVERGTARGIGGFGAETGGIQGGDFERGGGFGEGFGGGQEGWQQQQLIPGGAVTNKLLTPADLAQIPPPGITRSSSHADQYSTPHDDQYSTPPDSLTHSHSKGGEGATPSGNKTDDDKGCSICLSELATDPVTMKCCNEVFCRICIDKALEHSSLCPICRVAVKEVKGNQPPGTMSRYNSHVSLPGYEGAGTIVIKYSIPSGTQTTEHPNPGQRYHGTTREAFLPNTPEGQEVLQLLKKAFDARLIFTVGTSHTSGATNAVVWNDIHHKTVPHGHPYGYPDPNYLSRVKEELKAKGIQ